MSLISRLLGVTALCAASLLPAVRAASMEVGAVGDLEVKDASRHNTLQVRVTYPEADGTFPLIVFSHGARSTKDEYQPLARHWAAQGYVVLQVNHADSAALGGQQSDGFKGWADRAGDVSALIDQLDQIEEAVPDVHGKIDRKHIGVAGHSFGGQTAQLIAGYRMGGAQSYRDERVSAVVLLSPPGGTPSDGPQSWADIRIPMLTIVGSADTPARTGGDYRWRLDAYENSGSSDDYAIVLDGADHLLGGISETKQGGKPVPRVAEQLTLVLDATTDFWNAYLKNDSAARNALASGEVVSASSAAASFESKSGAATKSEGAPASMATLTAAADATPPASAPKQGGGGGAGGGGRQRAGGGGLNPSMLIQRLDTNGDGELSREEAPERLASRAFDNLDRNGDGRLSESELEPLMARAAGGQGGGRRSGGGQNGGATSTPGASSAPTAAAENSVPTEIDEEEIAAKLATAKVAELPPSRFAVNHHTTTLNDSKLDRSISLVVYAPEGPGPFPVIVFAPDAAGDIEGYERLLDAWAEQGYVVIEPQPSAESTSLQRSNPDALSQWRQRPEDARAVIDSLEELQDTDAQLRGKLDLENIGVGGHLIGAMASGFLVGAKTTTGDTFLDKRVKAALSMAPQGRGQNMDEHSWDDIAAPMLVISGSEIRSQRTGNPATWRTEPFTYSRSPDSYLVYIHGMDGRFGGVFPGRNMPSGQTSPALESYVLRATVDFWNAFLKNDAAAKSNLDQQSLTQLSGGIAEVKTKNSKLATAGPVQTTKGAAFEAENVDLVDPNRDRTLPIRIYAPRSSTDERLPTVVFTHGLGESRDSYHYLGEGLAQHGYNVVFISHPGSDAASFKQGGLGGLDTVGNVKEKAADLHFIINLLATDTLDNHLLRHHVDEDRLVMGGQCAGTSMAALMAGLRVIMPGNQPYQSADPHIKAIFLLGPQVPKELGQGKLGSGNESLDMLKKDSWSEISVPALVMAGERDFMWAPGVREHPRYRVTAYDNMGSTEKYLVDLKGAGHHAFTDSQPWYPAGPRNPMHHPWIVEAVTTFLDGYVKGDDQAIERLQDKELQAESNDGLTQEFVSQR